MEENSKDLRSKKIIQIAIEVALYIVFAALFINLVPKYVFERVSVDGSSMCDTLANNDQLIGEKITRQFNRLKRFDVVYFYPNGDRSVEPYIKRIIGLPGDTVQIVDSVIYINGMPLSEDYAREAEFEAYSAADPIRLGGDEYFVMGDNRNKSTDSRSERLGPIKFSDIEGRAVFRIWPITGFGKIR